LPAIEPDRNRVRIDHFARGVKNPSPSRRRPEAFFNGQVAEKKAAGVMRSEAKFLFFFVPGEKRTPTITL
jgi:hypothetical protein